MGAAKPFLPKTKSPLVPREVGTKGSDEPQRPGEDKSQGSPILKSSVCRQDTTTYSGLSVGVPAQVARLRLQRLVDRRKAIIAGLRHRDHGATSIRLQFVIWNATGMICRN